MPRNANGKGAPNRFNRFQRRAFAFATDGARFGAGRRNICEVERINELSACLGRRGATKSNSHHPGSSTFRGWVPDA